MFLFLKKLFHRFLLIYLPNALKQSYRIKCIRLCSILLTEPIVAHARHIDTERTNVVHASWNVPGFDLGPLPEAPVSGPEAPALRCIVGFLMKPNSICLVSMETSYSLPPPEQNWENQQTRLTLKPPSTSQPFFANWIRQADEWTVESFSSEETNPPKLQTHRRPLNTI